MSTYEGCPLRWRFLYVDRLPQAPKGYFSFGSALHEALEAWATAEPGPASLEATLEAYRKAWSDDGFPDAATAARERAAGEAVLERFWRAETPRFAPPVAVELPFTIDVEGVPVTGFIDRVDREGGGFAIVDYKSGRRAMTRRDAATSGQLTLYQMAVDDLFGRVERLTLHNLRSNVPVSAPRHDRAAVASIADRVVATAEAIEAGRFDPRLNRECPCEFANRCPYFAETAPSAEKRLPFAGGGVGDLARRYVALKETARAAEAEAAGVADEILAYMDARGVRRVEAGEGRPVTVVEATSRAFDLDEARRVLAEAGLLDRALDVDERRVRALMADPEAPREVRRRLAALERVTARSRFLRIGKTLEESGEPDEGLTRST